MGLLDDAIREHLELKRRRGDDPTEIERLEREALGPVRRGPDESEALPQQPAASAATYDEGPEEWEDELGEDGQADDEWEYEEPEAAQTSVSESPAAYEPHPVAPPPAAATPPPPAAAPVPVGPEPEPGAETVEYDVEAAHAAEQEGEQAGEGDDVLEETPEFLQDTPDHDRLWFEQRPPRDFDFDG